MKLNLSLMFQQLLNLMKLNIILKKITRSDKKKYNIQRIYTTLLVAHTVYFIL